MRISFLFLICVFLFSNFTDLFLTIESPDGPKFRVYELPITKLNLIQEYDPPPGIAIQHLSTFADIDADGELEHLLPVCMDTSCSDSRIYVRDNNEVNSRNQRHDFSICLFSVASIAH